MITCSAQMSLPISRNNIAVVREGTGTGPPVPATYLSFRLQDKLNLETYTECNYNPQQGSPPTISGEQPIYQHQLASSAYQTCETVGSLNK